MTARGAAASAGVKIVGRASRSVGIVTAAWGRRGRARPGRCVATVGTLPVEGRQPAARGILPILCRTGHRSTINASPRPGAAVRCALSGLRGRVLSVVPSGQLLSGQEEAEGARSTQPPNVSVGAGRRRFRFRLASRHGRGRHGRGRHDRRLACGHVRNPQSPHSRGRCGVALALAHVVSVPGVLEGVESAALKAPGNRRRLVGKPAGVAASIRF